MADSLAAPNPYLWLISGSDPLVPREVALWDCPRTVRLVHGILVSCHLVISSIEIFSLEK